MSVLTQLPFERPIYELEEQLKKIEQEPNPTANTKDAIRNMRLEITRMKREIFENLDAWDTVKVARHPERPQTLDYLELVFDEFVELHGDKAMGDDRAILTGFAKLDGQKVMFVGQQKGRTLQERTECYYGCAHPEGYRKALSKMKMAEKFGIPIICLIDTPGAYPGIKAEEHGQAYNIAINLREMALLKTPIICVVIGEGGSGGALGIGIGDHISVLQFAYYSVITPEGCAGILWKNAKFANEAAKALKFTSQNLLDLGIIDEVIPEPLGGAHRDHRQMATALKASLSSNLKSLSGLPKDQLVDQRYEKFRKIGMFHEAGEPV
ncbi:acetyl-CoA carboxylase carboxyltransferase subunit alpha [Gimesia chilikensis]|jgi:acetyl-CoA carboxylase carboxyl transferase subunit alpha|uniref:Acetyl-coenzyme A carboxylase carboxyl transferase subunit alpha n=1 Tax=Gimesia chilikensis TaxID=2605989 RepID=A0A517PM47_9PLAN|nr:acetyl-CoA carboxylase carboxyltransferase subunit alpha [Gimesia chilikensis]MBN69465.1 acetyl-CoA carboxylase carboxyl transferase subunit alpha [Gimesia sp.]MCR9231230.1 acetyl-CoA carboxylase carboxyltransferase subunit alpha [bacterium]QDT20435.1 Acetyl-coenzyme A carboxylase carboxyl transferase subunit alpha [Gimesia chilikensis]QDU02557.1 Acetyl-coenzyme A carboxylase carboxyl transferase subunit alpha [Gimesia chilikensis]